MKCWETKASCLAARRDVNALAAGGVEKFLDPVDYLRYVQEFVPSRPVEQDGTDGAKPPLMGSDTSEPEWPTSAKGDRPDPSDAPRLRTGDLHGRNILVGIVRDQAMWPTIFDYEDMSPGNLIGWDFVKLETELKIRAYTGLFGGTAAAKFIQQVQRFEIEMSLTTEDCHRNRSWPEVGETTMPEERLRAILLSIRRMAAQQLGASHGRPNDWLEEYYFLMACYGVLTGRFENLQPRERIGALVSAGVATARLSWPRSIEYSGEVSARSFNFHSSVEQMVMSLATLDVDQILKTAFPSYHRPLELARSLTRSGNEVDRRKAVELFIGLRQRYPHVLTIGQEQILALEECCEPDRAEQLLHTLEKLFLNLDEEFLCRWGRLFKDRGDEYTSLPWSKPGGRVSDLVLAEAFYRKSLAKYDHAYRIRFGHYPGINKAALLLILGSLTATTPDLRQRPEVQESEDLASSLLATRLRWPSDQPDDPTVWHPATAGEAHLLPQEWAEAANQYREALQCKNLTPHARRSIRRQAERILMCFKKLAVVPPPPFDDPALFFSTGSGAAQIS